MNDTKLVNSFYKWLSDQLNLAIKNEDYERAKQIQNTIDANFNLDENEN
jgi:flagellar basal body P-ring protein FlgI